MMDYIGIPCPVCGKKFEKGDDIVVCPECGAPHHRDCYEKNHGCANAVNHASGKEWAPPEPEHKEDYDGTKELRCPKCNTLNPYDGIFCQVCGTRLENYTSRHSETRENTGPTPIPPNPFTTPYGGISPDETMEDIPVKDIVLYVGENSFYFLPFFKEFSQGRRSFSWNWSAFIFHFFYFFFRKMWLPGILLLLFDLIVSVPSILVNWSTFAQMGLLEPLKYSFDLDLLYNVSMVLGWLSLAVRFVMAGFANRIYYSRVVTKVKQLRSQTFPSEAAYVGELTRQGRTNRNVLIITIIAFLALNLLATMLLLFVL